MLLRQQGSCSISSCQKHTLILNIYATPIYHIHGFFSYMRNNKEKNNKFFNIYYFEALPLFQFSSDAINFCGWLLTILTTPILLSNSVFHFITWFIWRVWCKYAIGTHIKLFSMPVNHNRFSRHLDCFATTCTKYLYACVPCVCFIYCYVSKPHSFQ